MNNNEKDPSSAAQSFHTPGVYERLGLQGCINATGHVTRLGGSLMPPEVLEAMAQAARSFIPVDELHRAAGKRLAELTEAEAALVTSGAAGAIVLGAAACIAGSDRDQIRRLPDSSCMVNEVLVPPTPGLTWVHYVGIAGGVVVEYNDAADLRRKINDRSAMLLYLPSLHDDGPIPLEELLEIGRGSSIPVMVDAADKLPPVQNLKRFNALKIDIVIISGGKGVWGPQCTGLMMGRKDLIDAAYMNSCAPGIGRPMKVGKEEIVGLLTAVEMYLQRDHTAEEARWERQLQYIEESLQETPGIQMERFTEVDTAEGKRLRIRLQANKIGSPALRTQLAEGSPRIMVGGDRSGALIINPQTMQPGEERLVASRLLEMLGG